MFQSLNHIRLQNIYLFFILKFISILNQGWGIYGFIRILRNFDTENSTEWVNYICKSVDLKKNLYILNDLK